MKIDIKNILNEEEGAVEEGRFEEKMMLEGLDLVEPVEGKYRLIRLEDAVYVHVIFRTVARINCARCLTSFEFQVEKEFDREFAFKPNEDQLQIGKDNQAEVSSALREEIILAFPHKPLCNEACKGLCPDCGKDLNVETCNCQKEA